MEEVFQMNIRLSLRKGELEALLKRLQQAYARGELRLIKRIHALVSIIEDKAVSEVAEMFRLSIQTIYNYISAFVLNRLDSLVYHCPPGRPRKLTKTQRQVLAKLIERGPEKAGYDCGCWDTVLIQDLIYTRFGVEYNPHYVAELLKNMGFSYQKGRFVSDDLADVAAAQKEWLDKTWPEITQLAQKKGALILFGDEASFAQWGSLSYYRPLDRLSIARLFARVQSD
jgi:transposase